MSIDDDFRAIVARLRGWGFSVREESGAYGRSNGLGWAYGKPVGHGNHHYVCALNPSQSYIDGLVSSLVSGKTVNWFADVNGAAYLIGTGPLNHFGTGNSSVLNRTMADAPPPGKATAAGDMTGNAYYSGTECQHPGDSTPWPQPLLEVMVAINAAEFLQWGYTPNRAINHFEWTSRKIDMSAGGGPASNGWAGDQLRYYVGLQMAGVTPVPPMEGVPLPLIVKRENDSIDWAWSSDMSIMLRIPSQAYYNNLQFAGVIDTDHGTADPCDTDFVNWFKGQVLGAGGTVYEPAQ